MKNYKSSNKTIKELYEDELTSDPYKEVDLSDIGSAVDPNAMQEAVKKQKKVRGNWDRLKEKLERK